MSSVAFLIACVACIGWGRRTRMTGRRHEHHDAISFGDAERSSHAASLKHLQLDLDNPMNTMAALLLGVRPAASWQASMLEHYNCLTVSSPCYNRAGSRPAVLRRGRRCRVSPEAVRQRMSKRDASEVWRSAVRLTSVRMASKADKAVRKKTLEEVLEEEVNATEAPDMANLWHPDGRNLPCYVAAELESEGGVKYAGLYPIDQPVEIFEYTGNDDELELIDIETQDAMFQEAIIVALARIQVEIITTPYALTAVGSGLRNSVVNDGLVFNGETGEDWESFKEKISEEDLTGDAVLGDDSNGDSADEGAGVRAEDDGYEDGDEEDMREVLIADIEYEDRRVVVLKHTDPIFLIGKTIEEGPNAEDGAYELAGEQEADEVSAVLEEIMSRDFERLNNSGFFGDRFK